LNLQVKPYQNANREQWEAFIESSANGTFMHQRSFMEYHGDRFEDASVMVWEGESLVSVLPAHAEGDAVFSHNGLSFGGWIFKKGLTYDDYKSICKETITYFKESDFEKIAIRPIPHFYWEDLKAVILWNHVCLNFEPVESKDTYVIQLPTVPRSQVSKRWKIRKSHSKKFIVLESCNFKDFWDFLLIPLYRTKIGIEPVHNIDEILKLKSIYPDNIRLFVVSEGQDFLAGVVVFETGKVAKLQYIASSDKGKNLKALDYIMEHFIKEVYSHVKFLDLGTVHHPLTEEPLEGLILWKESWGGKAMPISKYDLKLR